MLEHVKQFGGRVALGGSALAGMAFMALVLAGPSSASTDPAETAISDMGAKVTTYGTAILALVVLSAGIFLGIKYLRKGISKA